MDKITFLDEDNTPLELYVLEQTVIAGVTYLLAAQEDEDEAVAYILKEIRESGDDAIYEFVEDDEELRAISKVFEEMLEDTDIVM